MAYWETVERLLLVGKQDKAERELMDMGFSKTTSQEIINDYDIFEFRSRYNPFNSENDEQLEKVKFLTVKLKKGDIIFIPFKWFYTIKLLEPDTLIGISKYKVIMNTISILPELFHKFLTSQNIEINFINSIKL